MTEQSTFKNDDMIILADQISRSITELYDDDSTEIQINDDSIFIFASLCFIEINNSEITPFVLISFDDDARSQYGADVSLMMRDLYKGEIIVGNDSYVIDPANGDWYWGNEEIQANHVRVHGKQISPFISYGWFEDMSDDGLPHC
jgi:hypothetical protein